MLSRSLLLGAAALALSLSSSAQPASLRAGAARLDITPQSGPANPPSGKFAHERLFLRAIVLESNGARAVLIGADQGGLSAIIVAAATKAIAAELNCSPANIVMSATHSHSAGGGGRPPAPNAPPPDPNQPPPPIVAQILTVVRQAKANLQPARAGFATGLSYLNVNRDSIDPKTHLWTQAPNLNAPSDKTVTVLKFETPAGDPIAVYMTYAMHPVNGYLAGFTSADFPGAASRHIEQAYDDKIVAVFAQSASGDQNPLYLRASTNAMASRSGARITGNVLTREPIEAPLREAKGPTPPIAPKVAETLERVMESEGVLLAEEVIRVMTNITRTESAPRIAAATTTVTCPGRTRTDNVREGTPGTYVDGEPVTIGLGLIRIGNVALTWVNAEVYSSIAQRLKQQSPLANTFMVTLANGRANSGYIPDDASFGANSFQVLSSRLKPGCAESAIVGGLLDLIHASN